MKISKINFTTTRNNAFGNTIAQNTQPQGISSTVTQPISTSQMPDSAQVISQINKFNYEQNFELDYSKTFTLPNNLKVTFDTNPTNDYTMHAGVDFTPAKHIEIKPGIKPILREIIFRKAYELSEQYEKDSNLPKAYIGYNNSKNQIFGNLEDYYESDEKGIKALANLIINPNFTQEQLDKAKTEVKKALISYDNSALSYAIADASSQLGDLNLKNIDSITLKDIQDYYSNLLQNSKGKMTISMHKNYYDIYKDKILETISSEIPTIIPQDEKVSYETIQPISANKTYKQKVPTENKEYSRIFVIQDKNTLKDNIIKSLLFDLYEYNKQPNSKICLTSCTETYQNGNKVLKFESYPEFPYGIFHNISSNKPLPEELKQAVESRISELMNKPIDNDILDKIKDEYKIKKIQNCVERRSRISIMTDGYSDGDFTLARYFEELDKITPLDVQNYAKTIFSQNYIEAIDE